MDETRVTFTLNKVVIAINHGADCILRSRFDLTYSQFLFLLSLRRERKNLTEVAHWLGVSTAAVSKRAPWFEERGLVKQHSDPDHARKVLLSLTASGRSLVDRASTVLEAEFTRMFANVADVDLKQLNLDLNRVLTHLSSESTETA